MSGNAFLNSLTAESVALVPDKFNKWSVFKRRKGDRAEWREDKAQVICWIIVTLMAFAAEPSAALLKKETSCQNKGLPHLMPAGGLYA